MGRATRSTPARCRKTHIVPAQLEEYATTYHFLVQRDATPPVGLVNIDGGSITTADPAVRLTFEVADESPISRVYVSNFSDRDQAEEFAFDIEIDSWELPPGHGMRAVYVWFEDEASNWTPPDAPTIDVIYLDPLSP